METMLVLFIVSCAVVVALARLGPRSLRTKLAWLFRDLRRPAGKPAPPTVSTTRIDLSSVRSELRRARSNGTDGKRAD